MSIGAGLELNVVLQQITEAARDLVDARYAALGVLNEERSGLSAFVTVGLDDDQRARIGDLPKGHGLLGLLIVDPRPVRLPDLAEHPDSFGFPPGHPPMTSFLGVPVRVRGEVFGNLYLTDKKDGEVFTDVDEELTVALATAAGVAIDNARLHARVQELSLLEDRERIARDLHDTVIQRLFATGLSLQGAIRLAQEPEVKRRVEVAVGDLDDTVRTVRTIVFELSTASHDDRSVRRAILDLTNEASRSLGFDPVVHFDGPLDTTIPEELATQLLAVLRESLSNAARHAGASRVSVEVSAGTSLRLVASDDGVGVGPGDRAGHGLDNIRHRAAAAGGSASINAAPGHGTAVRWEVPLARL